MSFSHHYKKKIDQVSETKARLAVTDMHLHLVDFIQKTDGLQDLIKEMQLANIAKSVIFGLPVIKKWEQFEPEKPTYYLDDDSPCYYFGSTDEIVASEYLKLSPAEQGMLAPTLCGFNPTDRSAIDYVEYMFNKYPFWRGIGELFLRHDDLTALTEGERARVNHPALFDVYAFCAEKHLPVLIHHNSTAVMHTADFEYLCELEEVLHRFPETRFVWAHCGYSRRIPHKDYFQMVEGMLRHHPKLYVDFSWIFYDDLVMRQPAVSQKWANLVKEFSDRVMIGTDLCGHFDLLGKTMARYNGLLKLLPDPVQERIARTNAEEIYFR